MRTIAAVDVLASLYAEAAVVTANGSKSFFFATRWFPPDLARAAHAIYWFCRYTDDLVDECTDVNQGREDLELWALMLNSALAGEAPSHPVLRVFMDTVRRHSIPNEYALELIEGMRMDLDGVRYATFADLRQFCYRVASVVGLMMSHVIGFREPALTYAIDLGIAMQLTNILRDIGEDLERGRIYLPADEMERFGYLEYDLRRRVHNDSFRELMRFEAARARAYYAQAEPGIASLDSRGRFAVKVASDVYRQILARIEASDYNVFQQRAVVSPARKYWITARSMAIPIARHLWKA